eukprot:s3638_g4.t1
MSVGLLVPRLLLHRASRFFRLQGGAGKVWSGHEAAEFEGGRYRIAGQLLSSERGSDLAVHCRKAVVWSARDGQAELLEALLQRGASAEQSDSLGRSALLLACTRGHRRCAAALAAAEPQEETSSPELASVLRFGVSLSDIQNPSLNANIKISSLPAMAEIVDIEDDELPPRVVAPPPRQGAVGTDFNTVPAIVDRQFKYLIWSFCSVVPSAGISQQHGKVRQ